MPNDHAPALASMRRMVDQAGTSLSNALGRQVLAERHLVAAELLIQERSEHARDPISSDQFVEAFVAWLPEGRHLKVVAQDALDYAAAQSGQARAALALARAALARIDDH